MSRVRVIDGPDVGLVWHCGDPLAEQRAMEAGRGVLPLENRGIVEIGGPDRAQWLNSLTTRALGGLTTGDAPTALILSPTGRVERVLHGIETGEVFLAWTEADAVAELAEWLASMRFLMQVQVRVRDDLALVWFGSAEQVPDAAVATRASEIAGGVEAFLPLDAVPTATVGTWAFEAERIASGVPRIGVDTDDATLPNELGLYATDLGKGCYRGQEAVAHVHNLGRPPRRLVRLLLDGSEERLPEARSAILADDVQVGVVTSAAYHHDDGAIALGVIKRATGVDAVLTVDGIPATQDVIVDPEIGEHFTADKGLRRNLM